MLCGCEPLHTSDRWSAWSVWSIPIWWSRSFRADIYWSCTRSHYGRLGYRWYRWSRSWSIWSVHPMRAWGLKDRDLESRKDLTLRVSMSLPETPEEQYHKRYVSGRLVCILLFSPPPKYVFFCVFPAQLCLLCLLKKVQLCFYATNTPD